MPPALPRTLSHWSPARLSLARWSVADHAHLADRWGIGVAALCAAHCITTAIVVTALASFGGIFLNPIIHEVGLVIAVVLGAIGLGTGIVRHGYIMPFATGSFGLGMMAGSLSLPHGSAELAATLAGLMVLALGHDLNFRARK